MADSLRYSRPCCSQLSRCLLSRRAGGIVVPETWIASVDSYDAPGDDQPISHAAAERGPRNLAYDQDFAKDNPSDGAVARERPRNPGDLGLRNSAKGRS